MKALLTILRGQRRNHAPLARLIFSTEVPQLRTTTNSQPFMNAQTKAAPMKTNSFPLSRIWCGALALSVLALSANISRASVAYGTINNFDTVNDTGVECHGFEIELEDIHSQDITYTYNWNHYGTPKISEDNSNPLHSKVRIRYESGKTTNGTWAAYTAIPSGPIAPTDGHRFTDPSVNFGGEHFGAGYSAPATNIIYHWLIDDGAGQLIRGPAVNVATPTFIYFPP